MKKIEIYDTTLRDGSQLEGISLTVEDKLRIAEQLDWLGVDYIEAGWPGANPKDDELFRRAPTELKLDDAHARRVRIDASGQGQGRQRRHAAPSRRRQRRHGVHRREVVGLPRHRSARHHARRGRGDGRRLRRVPAARGHAGAVRRRALLRRLQAQPRVRVARARSGGRPMVRATSCCATPTAARCRTRSRRPSREVVRYFGGDVKVAVHLHDDAGTGVANALAGVRGGATQVQGTINGYGERTGNCNLTTIIPNLTLKMGYETIPRRSARAAHAGRASHRRTREHAAQPAGRVRGSFRVRAQGRAAHERDREATRRLRARVAGGRRERHPLRRVGARGEVDARA